MDDRYLWVLGVVLAVVIIYLLYLFLKGVREGMK